MKTEKIVDGNQILAIVIRSADWEEGLNFVSSSEDYQQVGIWGYNKGQKLAAHIHVVVPREIRHTQEVIFIKEGRVKADVYSHERKHIRSVELCQGDTMILLHGGHGYQILEDNTKVLEIKNGPYIGAERDRERI